METLHSVNDPAKVTRLAAAIEANGWQGAPLVADGEQLITGVHRYAAWRQLERPDYDLPVVDIRDLFAENNLDFAAIYAEESNDGQLDWDVAIVYVVQALPQAVRDAYGIDLE